MTPQQYVGLFVRLFAIWLFFVAAQTIGVGVALDSHGHSIAPYVIASLEGLAAVTLWCFPMFVADKLHESLFQQSTSRRWPALCWAFGCASREYSLR